MTFKVFAIALPVLLLSATTWADPIKSDVLKVNGTTAEGDESFELIPGTQYTCKGVNGAGCSQEGIQKGSTSVMYLTEPGSGLISDIVTLSVNDIFENLTVEFKVNLRSVDRSMKPPKGAVAVPETGELQDVSVQLMDANFANKFFGRPEVLVMSDVNESDVDPVPEPSSLLLLSSGLGLVMARRRRSG